MFTDFRSFVFFLITTFLKPLMGLAVALAFVYVLWWVAEFIRKPEEKGAREHIGWGIVALAVMMSVWGLVSILTTTFGVKAVLPLLPTEGGSDLGGINLRESGPSIDGK